MTYWIHVAHSIDRVTLHRDRCSEVPSTQTSTDYWGGAGTIILTRNAPSPQWNRRDQPTYGAAPSANLNGMLKQAADFVLASRRASTYGNKYASALRSLRPRRTACLNIP